MRLLLPLACLISVTAADQTTPTLSLLPDQVEQKRTIHFDDDTGRPEREESALEVQLDGRCSARLATGQGFNTGDSIKVNATALLDTGATLTLRKGNVWQHEQGNGDAPRLQVTLTFPAATSAARSIVRLSGSVNAPISNGRRLLAEVRDLGQGPRTVGVDALPDFELTVQRGSGEIKLSGTNKDFALLAEVKFLAADGTPINSRTTGGSSRNEVMERRYAVTLPSDGKVALYLHNQVQSVSIPFELTNIPLAMEAARTTRKVLITSEIVPDPVVAEPEVESTKPKAPEF